MNENKSNSAKDIAWLIFGILYICIPIIFIIAGLYFSIPDSGNKKPKSTYGNYQEDVIETEWVCEPSYDKYTGERDSSDNCYQKIK